MNIKILRSAKRTMAEAIGFYEHQEPGLGAYVLNSIMSDLRSLKIYAGVHQKYNNSYYRMVCKRFPYSIYYRKENSDVCVYAILDDRRDPNRTEEMLKKAGL